MNHRARKRFGQNFLIDPAVVARIVAAIDPRSGQVIVEIGPGQGALTKPLIAAGAELHLVEIDRDLADALEPVIVDHRNVTLHRADALEFDFGALSPGRPLRLVGNLPYNISTPLLFHVLRWSARIADMHFMLQREVVERMAAAPGTKARGRLSIACQLECRVTPLFDVPPRAFRPAPAVDSTVVRLEPHPESPVDVGFRATFDAIVTAAFGQRRKTLRNSLKSLLSEDLIEAAGVDPGARPETLELEAFAALSRQIV